MSLETTLEVKLEFPLNTCPKCDQKTLQCSYEGVDDSHTAYNDQYKSLCILCNFTATETIYAGQIGYEDWTDCPYCHESSQNHKKRDLPYKLEVKGNGA